MARLPSIEDVEAADKALQPYYSALGKVAHAWNHLHEELGKVFCAATQLDLSIGMAVWHSLKSDRSQREILEGAIIRAAQSEDWMEAHPGAVEGIQYLLKKVNQLAGYRNDAIHAPCIVNWRGDFEITPLTFFGNDKARRLMGKDILVEFEWYEKTAGALRSHASACRFALDAGSAWPEKPLLPTVGQHHSLD